jgi:predicted aspartyl protease
MKKALTLAILGTLAHNAQAATPDSLIAAARTASGGPAWDRITTWHEHGKVTSGGLSGTYETWIDLPTGRGANSFNLGPATGAQGYDGHVSWTTDSSGQVRIETSAESMAAARQNAYLAAWGIFFPKRFPATIAPAAPHTEAGITYDAIRVTPAGAEPLEIWFDPKTHLVAREVQLTGSQPQTMILSQYAATNGITVPFQTITRVGNTPKFDTVTNADAIDLNQPIPDARFAPPAPPAADFAFPAGKSSVTVPIHLRNNHIYLQAAINGKPAEFIFDTGAINFFDTGSAKTLGVALSGALPGGGFGSDISKISMAKVANVSIGGLTLKDQVFFAQDLADLRATEDVDFAGLLGYEFAKRAVLTVDYARNTLTLTKPESFRPPATEAIPFTFNAHVPMVAATVDGIPGEFEIDTGARSALTLMHPFASAHDLVAKYHATHIATVGFGAGGASRGLLARAGELKIGPVTLHDPVTDLVMDKAGAAAAARTAGNIGGDALKRFTLTLDYGHQKMWLQPNKLATAKDVFDRSGLWLRRAPDGDITIMDVTPGSAAAKAGLQASEEILSINGRPAKTQKIYDVRDLLKQAPGTQVHLSIETKTGAKPITLTLADQI